MQVFYYCSFEFLHGTWYLYPRLSLRRYAYLYSTQIQKYTVKTRFCILFSISSPFKINILSKRYYSMIKWVELQVICEQSAMRPQLRCAGSALHHWLVSSRGAFSTKSSFYLSILRCLVGRKSVSALLLLISNLLFVERRLKELSN